ncbi:hypothetical protein CFOL_v3_22933 [Cephalotus follicularis]|uniref:WRC domain-containing protein n=1 Tax=Cephalotus follicularis TaxID=3775 RepID=A0A1Q3CH66_CEPFO|nr:hypothetical protein CFOL_v3_22933 [Cephalotus follicularis]
MRIRKNAKLSSLIFSHASGAEAVETHVCQLNQSPWDVIPFSQEPYPSSNLQFEGDDSFIANASFSDSIGAVESVASMMELDDDNKATIMKKANEKIMFVDDNEIPKVSRGFFGDNDDMKIDKEFGVLRGGKLFCCSKMDSKGSKCKNLPKDGHSLCDHHLTLVKSLNNNNNSSSSSKKHHDKSMMVTSRRGGGRVRVAKKGCSSNATSNPYEFYYYSGFGPLWGKRRGDRANIEGIRKTEANKDFDVNISSNTIHNCKTPTTTPSSSSLIDNNEPFDYVDDDVDDGDIEEDVDNGKKRMRKPVKARSLKSLM